MKETYWFREIEKSNDFVKSVVCVKTIDFGKSFDSEKFKVRVKINDLVKSTVNENTLELEKIAKVENSREF